MNIKIDGKHCLYNIEENKRNHKDLNYYKFMDNVILGITGTIKEKNALEARIKDLIFFKEDNNRVSFNSINTNIYIDKYTLKKVKRKGELEILVSNDEFKRYLTQTKYIKDISSKKWTIKEDEKLLNKEENQIMEIYLTKIRNFIKNFMYADDINVKMKTIIYVFEYSFFKTIARKQKKSYKKVIKDYKLKENWNMNIKRIKNSHYSVNN